MVNRVDDALGLHAQALVMRSRRAEVLAENLANADTPNYLAHDLDFATLLGNLQDGASLTHTHVDHIDPGQEGKGDLLYRVPIQPAVDGNTVDVQREKAQFLDNALHYQVSLQLLDGKIRSLITAIRGE